MILIEKGKLRKTVTNSSFNNYFKNAGWNVVSNVSNRKKNSIEDEWAEVEQELEKPISDMNRQELEQKAISLGIDLNGLGSTKQLREAIRKHMA